MASMLIAIVLVSQNVAQVDAVKLHEMESIMDQHRSSKILKYTDDFNYFYNLGQQGGSSVAASSSANEEVQRKRFERRRRRKHRTGSSSGQQRSSRQQEIELQA